MYTLGFRHRLVFTVMVLAVFGLTTVWQTISEQISQDCQLESVQTPTQLYDGGTGGWLQGENQFRSDCYLVLYLVTDRNPPMRVRYYYSTFQAAAIIIGGKYSSVVSPGDYAIIRFELYAACEDAVAAAREFTQEVSNLGLKTEHPERYSLDNFCAEYRS